MIRILFLSTLLAIFAAFAACTVEGDATCEPACASGKVCKDGTCVTVASDAGQDEDGGISINFPDAGAKGDGGVQSQSDAGFQSCAAQSTRAEQLPLDMYIMLDQSGSMLDPVSGGTRWSAVTAALSAFIGQPNLNDVSVGLQYFALPDLNGYCTIEKCYTDADCKGCGPCEYGTCDATMFSESCNPADYAKPEVEIAPLPGVASKINASIAAHSPVGSGSTWGTNTPTAPALQGAINHARAWKSSHPQHVVIAVLATDGEPNECETNMTKINAIAAAGVSGTPKVLTFVIGVGDKLTNLNGIAAAGGTNAAFIVSTGQDVTAQFLAALNQIRGTALGCVYTIPTPASGTPDYTKVNVQYTPGNGGKEQVFPKVQNAGACPVQGDGWYYDNNASPQQIILCESTCQKVKNDGQGIVDVLLGCATIIN